MSLSPMSFEILSDLLELRLEAFLVTSSEETRQLKMLRHCQKELFGLRGMASQMVREMEAQALLPAPAEIAAKPKISRRLQRLVAGLQSQESQAVAG